MYNISTVTFSVSSDVFKVIGLWNLENQIKMHESYILVIVMNRFLCSCCMAVNVHYMILYMNVNNLQNLDYSKNQWLYSYLTGLYPGSDGRVGRFGEVKCQTWNVKWAGEYWNSRFEIVDFVSHLTFDVSPDRREHRNIGFFLWARR